MYMKVQSTALAMFIAEYATVQIGQLMESSILKQRGVSSEM